MIRNAFATVFSILDASTATPQLVSRGALASQYLKCTAEWFPPRAVRLYLASRRYMPIFATF